MACTSNDTSTDRHLGAYDSGAIRPNDSRPRKPWITPQVIVSELRNAGAQVGVGSDGTSPLYGYQYGS